MRYYDLKCTEGHYTETSMTWEEFQAKGHVCSACGASAWVVIRSVPQISVDRLSEVDYTQMAGRNFTSRKDRDAWLTSQQRWIPPADHPGVKEAFARLEHDKQEKRALLAKGVKWEDHVKDQQARKQRDIDENMKAAGVPLKTMTPKEVSARMQPELQRAKGDAQWFQERLHRAPSGTSMETLLADIPDMEILD